jgi:hypothetical protein
MRPFRRSNAPVIVETDIGPECSAPPSPNRASAERVETTRLTDFASPHGEAFFVLGAFHHTHATKPFGATLLSWPQEITARVRTEA